MLNRTVFAVACAAALVTAVAAQDAPIAFTNATIVPVEGDIITRGVLIVQRGKIASVASMDGFQQPAGATVVDCGGKWIMPGLVDTHNHIGGIGGADGSATLQPDVRIHDSLNVFDPGFRRAVAGGLTTLNIMPGSGHLMSGQTIYVKLRKQPKTIEDMIIRDEGGNPMGGLKMANGTNSIGAPPFSGTRGKSAAMVRELFIKAQEYRDKKKLGESDPEKMPARDIGMEALVEVLDGKRIVHHHTHRADDIITVLRLSKEFGFRVVLHHVSEAWKVADEIAAAKAPCSVIMIDSPGGKLEAAELSFKTGAVLEKAGALVAYHTDDWITDARLFNRSAALGVRAGLTRATAYASLTLNGAKMMDLDSRVGSLKAGKDADFAIWTADPLSVYAKVQQTWVEGVKVFDRDDPADRLFAVGGYGAGEPRKPYMCCCEHAGVGQ